MFLLGIGIFNLFNLLYCGLWGEIAFTVLNWGGGGGGRQAWVANMSHHGTFQI